MFRSPGCADVEERRRLPRRCTLSGCGTRGTGGCNYLQELRVEEHVPESIRFSRRETDSKDHSDWDLHVTINEKEGVGCSVQMVVSYSGRFWSVPLQAVFTSHVETAKVRLQETFSSDGGSSIS